jgi:hypothetical protein
LYLNRVLGTGATLTASASASAFPSTNLGDWKDFRRWHGSGATNSYTLILDLGAGYASLSLKCLALAGHNFNTVGARYKLEAGTNGVDFATAVVAYQTPANNKTVAHFFTDPAKRYLRLTIDNNGGANFTPQLGVLFLGDYLEIEDYIEAPFDPDAEVVHGSRQLGETGNILGMVTDWRERVISMTFPYLTKAWFTSTWKAYWDSYFDKPFVFVWDATDHATEAYLAVWNMDRMSAPYTVNAYRGPLNLSLFSRVETS